ncbi:MAG: outer membrane beta-barrel protein [Lentisphaerae bacterium]|nr:outer membrane beta-barrel protein [Lentisphaerota bacterium]
MKQIRTLIVAGMTFALAASALAASASSPVHVNNRLRLGYDDNVYQSDGSEGRPDKTDSFRIIEELEVLVNLNLERTYLGLRYRPTLMWYSDRDDDDSDFMHNLDLNFLHNFSPMLSLSVSDSLLYSQMPELQSEDFIVREDDDNYLNNLVGTLSYKVRPTTRVDVSGRYILLRYSDDSPAKDANNYYSVVGGLTIRQQLASLTTVNGDLRYQSVVYDEADENSNRDATSLFAGLGLEQTFTPQLIGNLRAGMESRSYDDDTYDDNTQPYGEVSMTFLPSPATRITGAASYSIYEADVSRYMSQNRTYFSLSLAHDFTAKWSFYASSAYSLNQYDADYAMDAGLPDADEKTMLVSARLTYRVNRINWLEAGWQYVKLDSDVDGRVSYDRNRVDIGWKIQLF